MNTKFKINSTDFIQICILSIFVIGNFFDYRLEVYDFNISYIFTTLYLAAFLFIIASKKFDKSLSFFILLFYLMILTQTMINWSIWGINEYENYSLNKFFILSSITLPMCLYVSTLDSIEKLKNIVKQISFVGGFLFIISIIQIFFSGINLGEQRMSVLGGGAIVFSRWVGIFFLAVFYDIINLKKMKFIILGLCFFFNALFRQ